MLNSNMNVRSNTPTKSSRPIPPSQNQFSFGNQIYSPNKTPTNAYKPDHNFGLSNTPRGERSKFQ